MVFFRWRYKSLLRTIEFSIFVLLSLCLGLQARGAEEISGLERSSLPPPKIEAKSWALLDLNSGSMLAEGNADQRIEPASLSKLMTAFVVFNELKKGTFAPSDMAHISEKAWRTGGSRSFVEVNSKVSVEDLLKGMIVQSGNDASVALAEHVAGSEDSFALIMNQHAERLGLANSNFKNSTGLTEEGHYSSARDLVILASAIIQEFPEYYQWYSLKEFTYNNITQPNRNKLLYRDSSVDGVKTGYTSTAGYCLIGSAERDGLRLIAAVTGADGPRQRTNEVHSLLKYGYAAYQSHLVYDSATPVAHVEVVMGEQDALAVGVSDDLRVTVPRGNTDKLKAELGLEELHTAPIAEGQTVGSVKLTFDDQPFGEYALVALHAVPEGSWWQRAIDTVMLWFN